MPRCLLGVSAAVLAGFSTVAASGELAKGYLVSLNDAFDTFSAAEVAAITVSDLLAAAGDDAPYDNPGYGLMQENSNGQYELTYYFDADGDESTVYFLQRTYLTSDVKVCIQYMAFDLLEVGHPENVQGSYYGVPLITNPMIYDRADCTFGQGPKNAALGPALAAWSVASAAGIASAAIVA